MDVKTTITITIDLEALKRQKAWLIEKTIQPFNQPEVNGLIHLLDAIQDNMVDNEKVPLKDVFGEFE